MNEIFDRKLLQQNQARALPHLSQHNFLYHEIANRIVENLQSFSRDFENCLEIGPRDGYLSSLMAQEKNIKNISQVEEESLPQQTESFDLIVSNLNLHHINFVPQFLLQIKSLLKPRGMFIASFFAEENLPELHKTIFEVESEIYNGISPRMIPTIDVKTAANLLQKAGFVHPISNLERVEVSYIDPLNLLKDLKMMGQGNIMRQRSRRFFTRGFLQKVLERYRQNYKGSGLGFENQPESVRATFEIVTIVGFKI